MTQFTDLYLRAATREEIDGALDAAGIYQIAPGVEFDRIGPFNRLVGYQEDGEPILATFDEYHINVRLAEPLTTEQEAMLAPFVLVPPATPFRGWAS